jgi:hypothetical protein
MVAAVVQEGSSTIDTVLGDGKEEVLGVHVLVNEMHPSFLMCHALAFTSFNKARVLQHISQLHFHLGEAVLLWNSQYARPVLS